MSRLLSILCVFLLIACSDADQPGNKTDNVFQGQIDSLNKAKTVEGTLMDADQQRQTTINDQTN